MAVADELFEKFQQARSDAFDAEAAGNYSVALRIYQALEGYIAAIPDQEREGASLNWRSEIKDHVTRLQRLVSGQRGIQQQKIEYVRPTCE